MNKREKKKQVSKRLKNINYSKIPYTNAIPNQDTVRAMNSKIYLAKDLEKY